MVRRSDHCLPSDSDKFTIKLHSLPSKFLSSPRRGSLFLSLLPLALLFLVAPAHPFRALRELLLFCGHMGAPSEEVVYSLAITITLCTPAPLSSPLPSLFLLFALLVLVWTRLFSPSFSFSLFSSLLCHVVSSPLLPRSSCRIDHGYSAIVFDLSCSCCGCRLQENFACLPLPRTLLEFFPLSSLSPSLSLVCFLHCSSFSSPCCLAPQAGIYFSTPLAPSFGLLRFLLPSALSFILEMGIGIHETKLMITTSKQRAERPTATCRAIYKSHSSLTSLFHLSPIQLFR